MKVEIKNDISAHVIQNNLKPKILVVSHERSGTHFLINSLASSFGYYNETFDFDFNLGINFYDAENLKRFFNTWNDVSLMNIMKSHHNYYFFQELIQPLLQNYKIFYIHRDPRDVMVSFWKFINHWTWNEGPKKENISDFVKAAPQGSTLRYQQSQESTMLERWNTHIKSWMLEPDETIKQQIHYVSYEKLNESYEEEMQRIAKESNMQIQKIERPKKDEHVIPPAGPGNVGSYKSVLSEDDLKYFRDNIGETMQKLGYL